ncbi:VacJ family lipoprotein [Lentibacter sp. XHP0401]|uniref:MlaA family lipoprotein n=1 Tax=Lentibacter sp. XHP0401 TaxID=2984334 RepID=UPI0021E705C6|nr:VacJ family lipoprotein [Lentibacter sp. XHP0401]MCV2893090.1 VacJ family lipoprotein [Lentibacter sp. XHP0401]
MLVLASGCTHPDAGHDPALPFDPYEQTNRDNHEFNRAVDRALLRPAGKGYVAIIPRPVQKGVSNFSSNLSLPGTIVNNVLQGRLGEASQNTLRFALNTTIGIGGVFDPSTEFKLYEAKADFGETLAVWGVREGAFVELPLLGPSTERDAVGKVVDLFTNPLTYMVQSPEKYYGTGASVASRLGDRGTYGDTIDSILYESADSYAQARTIYLQNRRFELGEAVPEDQSNDPFDLNTEGF